MTDIHHPLYCLYLWINLVYTYCCDLFYFGSLNIPLVGQLSPRPWASNLFVAKGHTHYCGLRMEK